MKTSAKTQRSNSQNKYYWGCVVSEALDYYKANQTDLIRDILDAVKVELTPEFIHSMFKMRFNRGQSTASNDTSRMVEYQDAIREHFYHSYKIDIPPPGQQQINYNE